MADEHIIVMTVECPHCKIKQKIHVALRAGFGQMGEETIHCLNCDIRFKVTVPDEILDGPFPA
jgi:transcription elongation factor Elf1